jgi:2-polyprenyl-6-methoxyphenol hydroxylase-like FAD-dependent oxidoreductase
MQHEVSAIHTIETDVAVARNMRGKPGTEKAVLVVGAGPTGLLLAGELARHGVPCRIIDEARDRQTAPRAITVHARSLEIFDDLGIVSEMVQHGRPVRAINLYTGANATLRKEIARIARLDWGTIDSPYPFMLGIPQPSTERVLEDFVERGGIQVERGVRFVGLAQDTSGVTVQLEYLEDGRTEEARFAWVAGCDGAHSTVRESMSLEIEGSDDLVGIGLIDMQLDWERADDEAHVFRGPAGALQFHPMPDDRHWRLAVDLPPLKPGQRWPEPTPDAFQAMVDQCGVPDAVMRDPTWLSYFRLQRRIVPRYRAGRVFLAGDAAHVHHPFGAQGMNISMQDAYNLAWKLALVIRGDGRPRLLDSYDAERRPVGEQVLRITARNTAATARGVAGRELRERLASSALRLEGVRRRNLRTRAEIDLVYRQSPIVVEDWAPARRRPTAGGLTGLLSSLPIDLTASQAPQPGERAPDTVFGSPPTRRLFDVLRGTKHVLLMFAGVTPTRERFAQLGTLARAVAVRHDGQVAVHIVTPSAAEPSDLGWDGSLLLDPDRALHSRWGADAACLYLIRPDGYVGYRARPVDNDRLSSYLDRIFAQSTSPASAA